MLNKLIERFTRLTLEQVLAPVMLIGIPTLMWLFMGTWPFLGVIATLASAPIGATLTHLAIFLLLKHVLKLTAIMASNIAKAASISGFLFVPYVTAQSISTYFGTPMREYEIDVPKALMWCSLVGVGFYIFGMARRGGNIKNDTEE